LTEVVTQNVLNDLEPEEIAAVISVFVTVGRKKEIDY
jgi:superfamily II RNA helicase